MNTIELLDKAVARSRSERGLALDLKLSPATLAVARSRGKLSTALAIVLAAHIGENVTQWAIQAVQENEKSEPLSRRLRAIKEDLKSGGSRANML